MPLLRNTGTDRVLDHLRAGLEPAAALAVATPAWSLFAFAALADQLARVAGARVALPVAGDLALLGDEADRPFRNQLAVRGLARRCREWIEASAEVRALAGPLPQAVVITEAPGSRRAITGSCAFTTAGLGLVPGNQLGLVQATEQDDEWAVYRDWFDRQWAALGDRPQAKEALLARLRAIEAFQPAPRIYHQILRCLLGGSDGGLDPERVLRTATGITETAVWKRLYRFQRDGVLGAIDKLDRYHGCIIADSVGLGKTFEALAVIKYHELRNDRVLVLCPKRLRDNWLVYRANDRRNPLAADRFHYDVLNHTDLSRDQGWSGDIDLAHLNWGNYDLVVIDESHNFRNKGAHNDRETRYERLMRRVIASGVRTRVLLLSATPVNNRLADLRNQIAFITEGRDDALADHGIASIDLTTRRAQAQFNRWLEQPERRADRLLDMLGFDYFQLLDLLTIARSRKHIEKYYGTAETGRFPERMPPINPRVPTDLQDEFPSIECINDGIIHLKLSAYAPLRYLLPHRRAAYDRKYRVEVRGGKAVFRQVDREESLIHLMRVNLLKRMESSVAAFALTLERQVQDIDRLLDRLKQTPDELEAPDIADLDIEDPRWEPLLVGKRVRVLLADVDRRRWCQDLEEDRDTLAGMLASARAVTPARDAKLDALRRLIEAKVREPLNPGNRKVLLFTAFADTAAYLYQHLAGPLQERLGLHTALVTGSGANRSTRPGLGGDLAAILGAFAPRAKERPPEDAAAGEIDLLIATDCISEGQNLQDCDTLINYDIHWNPVRIIQRFGRIDRIGSPNTRIQLINFWPNLELEAYIDLEQRVTGRMVLLDISATGEENLIDQSSPGQMNDLAYRRRQLEQLQHQVVDLEDLSNGVSIADLTFTDFRIDLAEALRAEGDRLAELPLGTCAIVPAAAGGGEEPLVPGVIFALRSVAAEAPDSGYPLHPHYLVQVAADGAVVLPYSQAKVLLDRLRRIARSVPVPDPDLGHRFDRQVRPGHGVPWLQAALAAAVRAIDGTTAERAVASLFTPGGTQAGATAGRGTDAYEVVAYLIIQGAW